MKKKKYYSKALSVDDDGRYKSLIISEGKYCLTYPPNRWVKPPNGYIFIFKRRAQALDFRTGGDIVKRCEARGVKEPRGNDCPPNSRLFRSFWNRILKNGSLPISEDWPTGTLWAKAVKIVE